MSYSSCVSQSQQYRTSSSLQFTRENLNINNFYVLALKLSSAYLTISGSPTLGYFE